jgi:hypothetical protein
LNTEGLLTNTASARLWSKWDIIAITYWGIKVVNNNLRLRIGAVANIFKWSKFWCGVEALAILLLLIGGACDGGNHLSANDFFSKTALAVLGPCWIWNKTSLASTLIGAQRSLNSKSSWRIQTWTLKILSIVAGNIERLAIARVANAARWLSRSRGNWNQWKRILANWCILTHAIKEILFSCGIKWCDTFARFFWQRYRTSGNWLSASAI